MFGKIYFNLAFTVFVFFLGCAQPKYIQSSDKNENVEKAQETALDCNYTFSKSGLCLNWYWELKPTSSKMGSLIFKTFRLNSFDLTPIEVDLAETPQVILWMPSMGHGSTPTQTERLDVGTYRAKNVFFIMPGEWDIEIQIKNGTEVTDESVVSLEI